MRSGLWFTILAGALLAAAPASAQQREDAEGTDVVVDLRDGTPEARWRELSAELGVNLRPNSFLASRDGVLHGRVPAARVHEVLARLRAQPDVEAADENFRLRVSFQPNDPQFGDQWHMTRVGAPTAWDYTCGEGAVVAVVDTGVACENHGDFTRVLDLAGTRCLTGYDFVADREHANDDQGHGTHVAGTIAQTTNNGFGVAGLAHCATILPVKVLDQDGYGSLADVAEGIRYAADQGAQVINLSLGGGRRSRLMEQAVAYARAHGALVVCAAGNNGQYVESPASEPGSFAVSATDATDTIAWFSSRGPEVALAAPGVNVLQQTICNHGRDRCEQFAAWSGTSMAAPHVAGVAALLVSMGVTDSEALANALRGTAAVPEHGDRNRELYGAGIVNAANAVKSTYRWQWGTRLAALLAAALFVSSRVRARGGSLASPFAWLLPAMLAGTGFFFLPWIAPSTQLPGLALLSHPVGDWSLSLMGASAHAWLPFANLGVVLLLAALGFARPALRAPIGGFALGTASFLLTQLVSGAHHAPVGRLAMWAWVSVNVLACLWVARLGLERARSESKPAA